MKFRKANKNDLPAIVQMLADDALGKTRELYSNPLPESYYRAFDIISADNNQELIVVEDEANEVVGTLQLSHITYIAHKGTMVTQVEAVRIRSDKRSQGIGDAMFQWVIVRAREKGARVVQLTTDKQRPDAKRFYEKLGFVASHEGMKLKL
ncbi:GNAT family N-acetyltransferase [Pseudochryseolinea flava]|uniref:GNAT family N-acetyltransferase n=1 Tax=Pseudochryseolinea flava TaxID=2059302 RepID=A0A364Y2J2_9BACT|nr:GNAT family N-acetyltransferase [Pseudochryseolinea flava]RAW00976.1 GNAT family N-acetyltransferase [Pseudochryseolinea flava]